MNYLSQGQYLGPMPTTLNTGWDCGAQYLVFLSTAGPTVSQMQARKQKAVNSRAA